MRGWLRAFPTANAWRSATGWSAHDIWQEDPLLVDPVNGDLRLKPGSPAIGASSDGSAIGAAVATVAPPDPCAECEQQVADLQLEVAALKQQASNSQTVAASSRADLAAADKALSTGQQGSRIVSARKSIAAADAKLSAID